MFDSLNVWVPAWTAGNRCIPRNPSHCMWGAPGRRGTVAVRPPACTSLPASPAFQVAADIEAVEAAVRLSAGRIARAAVSAALSAVVAAVAAAAIFLAVADVVCMAAAVSAVQAEPVPASVSVAHGYVVAAIPAVADVAVADFSVPVPACMPAVEHVVVEPAVAAVPQVPAAPPVPSGRRGFPGSFPCRPPLSSPRFPSTGRHSRVLSPV